MSQPYQPRPTVTGYYWMRWRQKWGRRFTHDVVWYSEYNPDEVRVMNWHKIDQFPHVSFSGPLQPPGVEQAAKTLLDQHHGV